MYKIYINGRPLVFSTIPEGGFEPSGEMENLTTIYTGSPKSLLSYVDMLEKNPRFGQVTLYSPNVERLFSDFKTQFTVLEAAGGLVFNDQQEALFIYRRGSWDLPKGKIDPGESPQEAAVREVQEETGLQNVELGDFLQMTYHTYRDKKHGRVFKPTYWYRMKTSQQELVPQAEEDIEEARWMNIADFLAGDYEVYGNIRLVLEGSLGV